MTTFVDYLNALQLYTSPHQPPVPLIGPWSGASKIAIEANFRSAIQSQGYIGWQMPNFAGSNQSLGNQAAKAFLNKIAPAFTNAFRIQIAPGKGYPDTILTFQGQRHFLEFKATSDWNGDDTNRRVLTSSPRKMLDLVASGAVDDPPSHAIATVLYQDGACNVLGFRLDFIEPSSIVNVRLEASTSHKLLSGGNHSSFQV